jgi:hypothetical protein
MDHAASERRLRQQVGQDGAGLGGGIGSHRSPQNERMFETA